MSNAVLNEKVFNNWAPPEPGTEYRGSVSDGPSTPWRSAGEVMTIGGTISATATLLALLLASATVGWLATGAPAVAADGSISYGMPGLAILGVIVGIAAAFAIAFQVRPLMDSLRKVVSPLLQPFQMRPKRLPWSRASRSCLPSTLPPSVGAKR